MPERPIDPVRWILIVAETAAECGMDLELALRFTEALGMRTRAEQAGASQQHLKGKPS